MRAELERMQLNQIMLCFFSPDGNDVPEDIQRLVQKSKEGYDIGSYLQIW